MPSSRTCIHTHTHTHTHTHNGNHYSALKKNKTLPFVATRMDLEGTMLSEISKRKTNTICGTKTTTKDRAQRYREQIGGCQRWGSLGVGGE